jgi:hypothetical protein
VDGPHSSPWSGATVRRGVEDSALAWGYPFRSRSLFWEAVPAAEDAAESHPPTPTWSRACGAPRPRKPSPGAWDPDTRELLTTAWCSVGLILPG